MSRQRWLVGDGKRFTEADIRLFMTLVRFDEVYTQHFKCTYRYLREYKNLHEFTCDVYQIPKMDSVINMKHIREHYFTSHETINRYGIIPKSPEVDFRAPHDRAQFLSSTPGLPGY